MKEITVSLNKKTDIEGKKANEKDYNLLLEEDAIVKKDNGDLLCILLKRHHDPIKMKQAFEVINEMDIETKNRGTATGEGSAYRVRKDGSLSNIMEAKEFVDSGILGFFERTARFPYCRACAWNLKNPEKFDKIIPLALEAEEAFKLHANKRYEAQKRYTQKTHPDFLIKGTNFTTLTVNKNFRTAYHKDKGNLPQGLSCMSVIRKGKWTGANLVFPSYDVAVKLDSGDLIIFDPHEFHGNTPLVKITEDAIRCSIVYYFREKMQQCRSNEDELKIALNRKQGEQLFKTQLRKKDE